MKWAEISIRTSHEAMDLVAETFRGLGASGVVIEDPALVNDYLRSGIWDCTDIQEAEETEIVTVKAYLPADDHLRENLRALADGLARLSASGINQKPGSIEWNEVQDEDWANSWKKYFHAEKVGERIVIRPTWETHEASPGDIVIALDPGMAFGTGTHPTTVLCIRELEKLVKGGMRVVDVGTGSGVLAIAAAKLGAAEVLAVDNDGIALETAEENIRQNGVGHAAKVMCSNLLDQAEGEAEIIVANIVADVIIRLLDGAKAHLAPGGRLLASGIIAERVPDVTEAAVAHGFAIDHIADMNGWAAMVLRGEAGR